MATGMNGLWYFAYGSNMTRRIFVERREMRPQSVRTGWLDGHRLCFALPVGPGERGVANLELADGERTHGVLYLLTDEDAERLDRSEGVHRGFYARLAVQVATNDGPVAAFTYRSEFSACGRKPSARYLGLLLEGAREHGLPDEYVRFLESFELAVDERIRAPAEA
jgi:cation transport regulator ChaC